MKNVGATKRLFFINLVCLLWWPNYCDIQNEAGSQGIPIHKTLSVNSSDIKDVPSNQEVSQENLVLGTTLKENDVLPNVEYVNNPELEGGKYSKVGAESVELNQIDAFEQNKKKMIDLESSRHISITANQDDTFSKRKSHSEDMETETNDLFTQIPAVKEELVDPLLPSPSSVEKSPKFTEAASSSATQDTPTSSKLSEGHVASSVVPDKIEESTQQQSQYEGMPSFDEWKKMMLAEQEKGGEKVPSPALPGKKISSQKRRRNYSSYECGAKIVSSNPEAEGTSRILNELVDEYMLNPCKEKIWFVIELCETVQASQIELANFELFSSCPKDFTVYSSDNFPTRDWVLLGTFTAAEQRVLQSFELKQEGFGKFIKIELQSHYGKEHYCPLSVVRIFGTSMVDEYEEMETLASHPIILDDDLDRLDIPVEDSQSTNIFGSATDAVINIVKKAAQALGHQPLEDGQVNDTSDQQNMSESKLCKLVDISSEKCGDVPVEDKSSILSSLPEFSVPPSSVHQSLFRLLQRCDQCVSSHIRYYSSAQPHCRFFQAALGPVVFQALCDWFKEHPMVIVHEIPASGKENIPPSGSLVISPTKSPPPQIMRIPSEIESSITNLITNDSLSSLNPSDKNITFNVTNLTLDKINKSALVTDRVMLEPSGHSTHSQKSDYATTFNDSQKLISKPFSETVQPSTETVSFSVEFSTKESVIIQEETTTSVDKSITETETQSIGSSDLGSINEGFTEYEEEQMKAFLADPSSAATEDMTLAETIAVTEMPLNYKPSEEKSPDLQIEFPGKSESVIASGIPTAGQKESVFMRMSNRIKALEINMSLSSQYLQELSQRYRRQMEEMQRAFNRTIGTLNDTARKAAEKDTKQQEALNSMQLQVANLSKAVEILLKERTSALQKMMETHICLMIVEAIIMITIMSLCVRRVSSSTGQTSALNKEIAIASSPRLCKRRSSADSYPPIARKVKKRSASEEALNAGEDFLIIEPLPVVVEPVLKVKKKNRKRNRAVQRSISHPIVQRRHSSPTSQGMGKQKDSHSEGCILTNVRSKHQSCKSNYSCENCNDNCCTATEAHEKERRLNTAPFQNLTNGSVIRHKESHPRNGNRMKEKEKFSFKKLLKFHKRDSI